MTAIITALAVEDHLHLTTQVADIADLRTLTDHLRAETMNGRTATGSSL